MKKIYLYVKTHSKTGLKYLGKTAQKDPHKYRGSGTYWKAHLKKHGATYSTEILHEFQTNDEVETWGLYYSELWNVVESTEWANLKPEAGDGGGGGCKHTPEIIAKVLATKKANGTTSNNPEIIAKRLATQKANGTLKRTPACIAKMLATKAKNKAAKLKNSD